VKIRVEGTGKAAVHEETMGKPPQKPDGIIAA
jgi:hypothetical protein